MASFLESLFHKNPEFLEQTRHIYSTANHIQHIYGKSFFSAEDTQTILEDWPSIDDSRWNCLQRMVEFGVGKKLEIAKYEQMPQRIASILQKLQTKEFVESIESITGIPNLKSDLDLYGGGMVYTPSGGFLKVHADFNYYEKLKMYRRINLIVYMNELWPSEWKGNIEFWNEEMTLKVLDYPPYVNTFLLFRVNDKAFHGYPEPIQCPANEGRKSLNFYFYSTEPDSEQSIEPHKTIWKDQTNQQLQEKNY